MRYQNPSLNNVINQLCNPIHQRAVVFLYFQYASSTRKCFEAFTKELSKYWVVPKVTFINQFYTNHKFISAWQKTIVMTDAYDKIVFFIMGYPIYG